MALWDEHLQLCTNKVFQWVEFFSGTAMATRCMTQSGLIGCPLDILDYRGPAEKQNYLDLLTPAGMSLFSCILFFVKRLSD